MAVLRAQACHAILPKLVEQCICVSFTKIMVGVHMMCY